MPVTDDQEGTMPRRIAPIMLALALLPSGLSAQRLTRDSASVAIRPQAVGLAVLGGVVGSAVGFTAGLGTGAVVGAPFEMCSPDNGSFCPILPVAIIGSLFGSAMGAYHMARESGADPSLRTSLWAASAGLIAGLGTTVAAAQINDSSAVVLVLGFSVGQGVLTGLVAALR